MSPTQAEIRDPDQLRDDSPSSRADRWPTVVVALSVVAVVMIAGAAQLADLAVAVLPGRGRVRGLGTNYDSFDVVAPAMIRRTGFVLLATAASMAVAGVLERSGRATSDASGHVGRWTRLLLQLSVATGTAIWYGWLATPHNAFRSNARFHWVDYITFASERYVYVAGRLPHYLFYDRPFLWQSINVFMIVVLLAWIGNKLRLSTVASVLLCAAPATATNLLLFADTSEGVTLNVLLLLAVAAAMLARRPALVGATIALAVLGRPQFISLIGCVIAAELLLAIRQNDGPWLRRVRNADWRFTGIAVGAAGGLVAASQVLFTIIGERYFLTNGRLANAVVLEQAEPIVVDGFTISAFSGAYVLHFLWVLPAVLLIGTAASSVIASRLSLPAASTVHFCVLATVTTVLLHESQPLNAYNIRYISYTWPFLLIAAWVGYAHLAAVGRLPWRAGAVTALALGIAVLPADPVGLKRNLEARAETELFEIRREVDELVGDGDVVITFGSRSTMNAIAYVIKDSRQKIGRQDGSQAPADVVVITRRTSPLDGRDPTIETRSLLIYAPESAPE